MIQHPADFYHLQDKVWVAEAVAGVLKVLCGSRRGLVVQAGGCIGLWPLALSKHFKEVWTFEPEPVNFACLRQNVAGVDNIITTEAALGSTPSWVGMTRPKAGAGLWRVDGLGEIPAVTLDDFLGDTPLDALVLDVEGSELAVWAGAEKAIQAHRPLLWFEYLAHTADIDAWLDRHGYVPARMGIGSDRYSVSKQTGDY